MFEFEVIIRHPRYETESWDCSSGMITQLVMQNWEILSKCQELTLRKGTEVVSREEKEKKVSSGEPRTKA